MKEIRLFIFLLASAALTGCMDKISDKDQFLIEHIVFKTSADDIKLKIIELQILMGKLSQDELGQVSYTIEKLPLRYSIFNFNHTEFGKLNDLNNIENFRNLNKAETKRFVYLINYLNNNGLNGAVSDQGAMLLNYRDSITVPTNWTERVLILKNNSEVTKNWMDIKPIITQTENFALLDWD